MAHLTDMEELISTISSADIRDYMREAMSCYMASAYRGAVVLSYIALFDDLLLKLAELASVNSTAKGVFDAASKKKDDQDVYESFLIDQLTSKHLISGLDSSFLATLRTLRNKSAHPSGHKPSPEEARYIFFETISRFLSKPILSTTHLVDEIVERLKNTNFFPSKVVGDIKSVVGDEILPLHPEATNQLVARLTSAAISADSTTASNAQLFLIGLAQHDQSEIRAALQNRLITPKSDDAAYADLIVQALSASGKLFIGLTGTCQGRIKAIVSRKISEITGAVSESKLVHPTHTLASIAAVIPESEFLSAFQSELQALFEKRAHSAFVIRLVSTKPSLLPLFFSAALGRAGSGTFEIANSFADAIEAIDEPLSKLLSDEQSFQILVAVMQAANWGAWSAKGVANAKFASVPLLRAKGLKYINEHQKEVGEYISSKLSESKSADEFVKAYLVDLAG